MNANAVAHRRLRTGQLRKKMQAIANVAPIPAQTGFPGPRDGTYMTCEEAVVVQLSADVSEVAVVLNVTEVGANEHTGVLTAPAGPVTLALNATLPAKPPLPVTVTVDDADCPGDTLADAGSAATVKVPPPPPPPPATVILEGADSLVPKVVSPA
jgi:hypothetical protein